MVEDGRLRFALTLIEGRLHKAAGDKCSGCGQCSHWIAVAARRSGVTREHLEAALPPPAKPQRRRSRLARPGAYGSATRSPSAFVGAMSIRRRGWRYYSSAYTIPSKRASWPACG